MKKVNIGSNNFTEVLVMDEPGQGGACHEYEVCPSSAGVPALEGGYFAKVSFQKGSIKENGVNGCKQEDLLEIVAHRLEYFQAGDLHCIENQIALNHVKSALGILGQRTQSRIKRGVEGIKLK